MKVHGYEIISEWKNSQCGQTAIGKKGGVKYFIKKYQTPVEPIDNKTLDKKTFAHNKALFDKFVSTRQRINTAIRAITGAGGNIIIPSEEFILDNHYVEAAELVDGVVPDDELESVLGKLSVDVKKLLMQTAAGALQSVHTKHIIHSDLKLKNVLLVKNSAGNYVAKLIDFDSSYFRDEKPDEVVGTIDYYSPELGVYADIEDEEERAEAGKKLTEKSDIFSLGLIFHFYLSGELPKPVELTEKLRKRAEKGKIIYCWVALNSGCSLKLSPAIKSPKYISLINDMLNIDPEKRPTAIEVLKRLREDEKAAEEAPPVPAPEGFCEPWEEHTISFDEERIKSRGFVSVLRDKMSDIKGYKFVKPDSSSKFFKEKDLIAMKYAVTHKDTPKEPERGIAEPWEEHDITFDEEVIKAKGFVRVERDTLGGVRGYRFIRPDGTGQFLRVEMVIVQKLGKKK
ncbi:MAG: protein kinase [Lachnospiraceae bacterium]|nr:protein kinase [Lachnospiraceae bacterium]